MTPEDPADATRPDASARARPLAVRAGLLTATLVAAAAGIAALVLALGLGGSDPLDVSIQQVARDAREAPDPGSSDPLAFAEGDSARLVQRAMLGTSHVIYAKSPDGVEASAQRTAQWRDDVERAAEAHGVSPDILEAMVFLESAGRPTVMADGTPSSASGLAQIIPSTAVDLLGMRVDLPRSIALTKRIDRAIERGEGERAHDLVRERAQIDQRFDPEAALNGAARYLQIARERFGSEQLAVVSYHMGIGNLESVIERFTGTEVDGGSVAEVVEAEDLDYARLFFDSSPLRNERAWDLLGSLGDDSSTYLWRVYAAARILRLRREDPDRLAMLAELQTAKATAEEVFHPEETTEVFADQPAIEDAIAGGELVSLPDGEEYGFRVSRKLGELARRLGVAREPYRSLRPEALAALVYMSARVREINRGEGELTVTSAVRDRAYQEALIGVNPEATRAYSLHTTGYSFDVLRRYSGDRQAAAFQFVLDRLRALAVIDYAVEPRAIHVTVSNGARPLLEG